MVNNAHFQGSAHGKVNPAQNLSMGEDADRTTALEGDLTHASAEMAAYKYFWIQTCRFTTPCLVEQAWASI